MEAIVKKMQAMKVQKDNACDDADTWEEKARMANIKREKLEGELAELITPRSSRRSAIRPRRS